MQVLTYNVPVLVGPELVLKVLEVGVVISKGGLALYPVDDVTINSNGNLQLEVGRLVVTASAQ